MNISPSDISHLRLFQDLSPCIIEHIATHAQEKQFAPHEVIFSEAEQALGFHIILQGTVKLIRVTSHGRELVLFIAKTGQTIGESAVFQSGTHVCTAVTMKKTASLFLPQKLCFELIHTSSAFALRMLSIFSLRQNIFVQKLAAQGERNATRRVAGYILHSYFMEGAEMQTLFHLSREDMANLLGLARETLSRQLSHLIECGAICVEGRSIRIKNEHILRSKATGE